MYWCIIYILSDSSMIATVKSDEESRQPPIFLCLAVSVSVHPIKTFHTDVHSKGVVKPEYWFSVPLEKYVNCFCCFQLYSFHFIFAPSKTTIMSI